MIASTSRCCDQSKYDECNHDQNLGTAEPEFKLSEKPNAKVVDCNDRG